MAATSNQVTTRSNRDRSAVPVDAGEHIYEGTMFFVENGDGLAVADTGSGANKFGGVALQEQDNTNGADGALTVQGYAEGIFEFPGTGFTQASVGQRVYATDNFTVTTDGTTANAVYVGECEYYVSSTVIGVKIDSMFTGKLPLSVQAGAAQAAVTVTETDALVDSTGGTPATTFAAITAPGANATTSLSADMLAVKNALSQTVVDLNKSKVDLAALATLANAMRTALINAGIIKGAA